MVVVEGWVKSSKVEHKSAIKSKVFVIQLPSVGMASEVVD